MSSVGCVPYVCCTWFLTSEFNEGLRAQFGQSRHPHVMFGSRLRVQVQRPCHGCEDHGVLILSDLRHILKIDPSADLGVGTVLVVAQC